MTASPSLQALSRASTPAELLRELKTLKNSVIGNTWKKVEYASDDALLVFLLGLLEPPKRGDRDALATICETAVILGALGSAGALTLRPLLAEHAPQRVLSLIRALSDSDSDSHSHSHSYSHSHTPAADDATSRMLPPLLRALRNMLGATADAVWGHMWGVGTEQKVVGTGLVGDDVLRPARVRARAAPQLRADASDALALVFEPENRRALLALIETHPQPVVLLPLYQLLARLIVLPHHREMFAGSPVGSSYGGGNAGEPRLVPALIETVWNWCMSEHRPNPRLLEAALDLLAALVKGQPAIARAIRDCVGDDTHSHSYDGDVDMSDTRPPDMVQLLVQLLETGPPGVRIAVASCLTNILKADKGREREHTRERVQFSLTSTRLLGVIIKLGRTEGVEERVKLCFILASLVSDDERLQKAAAEQACPSQLVSMLLEVDGNEERGEMGHEAAARSREAALLALAALSFNHEPTRSHIADAAPPVLPLVCAALSHPSYGVRAAACQLARALSRTVSIVRTSLVDSGVAEEVIETLKREIERRQVGGQDGPLDARDWDVTAEEELGNRMWTVEEAATATICNLVTDFAPVRNKFLSAGGIELFVGLTSSTHEPLVENALWTLKNLLYHAPESLKSDVMAALGWPTLREMVSPGVPPLLRRQALELLQNIVDNQLAADLALTLDGLGADWLVDTLTAMVASAVGTAGGRAPSASEEALAVPSLYVLSQLALGSERQRAGLTARVELLDALSQALNSRNDSIRYPALRTLTNLVKSNARGQRPRQAVVDLLQPYQLRMRLRDIAERAGAQRESVTAGDLAVDLLNLLERAR